MKQAVVLVAHGTVDDLDLLPDFAARIRRGHPAPPELLAELRRRYEAIGGQSPLNAINQRLAGRLEGELGVPVRVANRLASPFVKDVLVELVEGAVERVVSLPLAQYSAPVYAEAVKAAAAGEERTVCLELVCAPSWALEPGLLDAYADAIVQSLPEREERARTTVVVTAHSLPVSVIRAGDAYEREFRAAVAAVVDRVTSRSTGAAPRMVVAFQSQGMSAGPGGRPVEWLGPDLPTTIDECIARGDRHLVFAPVGFLADHVEILFDLDIEARALVESRGAAFHRTPSLNDSDALVRVLAGLARPLLHAA
jgi:ferrochelatase